MLKTVNNILKDYIFIAKELFTPNELCDGVEEIILDSLYHKGYRTIFLDIDNTLITYDKRKLSLQKINWVQKCKTLGFEVFLVSNNLNHRRMRYIASQLDVEQGLYFALKPFAPGIKDLASRFQIDLATTVVIGDQLFTDVLMGNWLKCYTILVDPLDKKLSFLKTLQRDFELFLVNKLHKWHY
jgi:HAD superfamily phosphatase (TIGR01668 family)